MTTQCNDERLIKLLQSEDDVIEYETAEHLEICSYCQTRMEALAAEPEQWQLARDILTPSMQREDGDDLYRREWTTLQNPSTSWTDSMWKSLLSPPSHPEMLGRIGRYDVERLIGSGGMGVVCKAYDTELNRPVAVKLLAPQLAENGSARKRFAREARAAAAVVDEHVVAIHNVESGDDPGQPPFLVMKYIAGGSLQQRLDRGGPLETCEILRIGMQTAKGLAAAHAQGLIHRDVKPSNILLDEGVERALLTDFGLARAEDDACLTRSGFHPGTPHYMSPEQVRGQPIDGRSDLFGLGCVLYALCTGHPPFRAETSYAVLRRITDDPARPIRELNPNTPVWLERIVMKLLSKSRDDRFESAEEVAGVLEDCLAHVSAPLTNKLPRIASNSPWLKRYARVMSDKRILSLFALSLFVAAVVLPWPIAALARDGFALMFAGSALLMAFFFAVLSRGEYFSRIILWTSGVILGLLALATVVSAPLYFWRNNAAEMDSKAALHEAMDRAKAAERMAFQARTPSISPQSIAEQQVIFTGVGQPGWELVMRIEKSGNPKSLEWASSLIEGAFDVELRQTDDVTLDESAVGKGIVFETRHGSTVSTSIIAMDTVNDKMPHGTIRFYDIKPINSPHPTKVLHVGEIVGDDGSKSIISLVLRPLSLDGKQDRSSDNVASNQPQQEIKPPKLSPFTDIQFIGDQVLVTYEGQSYQWVDLDGIKVEEIVSASKSQFEGQWQKRISEDLVEVLWGMDHRPGNEVKLLLIDLKTKQDIVVDSAPLTEANRKVIYRKRRLAEDVERKAVSAPVETINTMELQTDSEEAKRLSGQAGNVVVDIYCGSDVGPQMNTQGSNKATHVRLIQDLNAIDRVICNLRVAGKGNSIFHVIVRDPARRLIQPNADPNGSSKFRDSIMTALNVAGIRDIRWESNREEHGTAEDSRGASNHGQKFATPAELLDFMVTCGETGDDEGYVSLLTDDAVADLAGIVLLSASTITAQEDLVRQHHGPNAASAMESQETIAVREVMKRWRKPNPTEETMQALGDSISTTLIMASAQPVLNIEMLISYLQSIRSVSQIISDHRKFSVEMMQALSQLAEYPIFGNTGDAITYQVKQTGSDATAKITCKPKSELGNVENSKSGHANTLGKLSSDATSTTHIRLKRIDGGWMISSVFEIDPRVLGDADHEN